MPERASSNTGIKAGMFARGDFQLGRSSALTVPQASIVPRDGFNHLLLLQPDNRVAQLKVETGRRVGDRVEITTALPADARWWCRAPASSTTATWCAWSTAQPAKEGTP